MVLSEHIRPIHHFRAAVPRHHSCKENLPVIALKESATAAALLVEAAERNEAVVAVTELEPSAWAIEFEVAVDPGAFARCRARHPSG
jgi:hypothetical protein